MQGLSTQLLGPVPLSVAMETKVSISHQALLQHLLQKEQLRHQKILSTGKNLKAAFPFQRRISKTYIQESNCPLVMTKVKLDFVTFTQHRHVKLQVQSPWSNLRLSASLTGTVVKAHDCPLWCLNL